MAEYNNSIVTSQLVKFLNEISRRKYANDLKCEHNFVGFSVYAIFFKEYNIIIKDFTDSVHITIELDYNNDYAIEEYSITGEHNYNTIMAAVHTVGDRHSEQNLLDKLVSFLMDGVYMNTLLNLLETHWKHVRNILMLKLEFGDSMVGMVKLHGHWIPSNMTYDQYMMLNHFDQIEGVAPKDIRNDDCTYFELRKMYKVLRVFKKGLGPWINHFVAVVEDEDGDETTITIGTLCHHIDDEWKVYYKEEN